MSPKGKNNKTRNHKVWFLTQTDLKGHSTHRPAQTSRAALSVRWAGGGHEHRAH